MRVILKHEGGFINNDLDLGGPTNYGITQKDLSAYLGRPASIDDVERITINQTLDIYKKNYWNPLDLDKVTSDILATVIFDLSVLRGIKTITKELQDILNVTIDGVVGPDTIIAINASNAQKTAVSLIQQSQSFFVAICVNNRNQITFLSGWTNRCHSLINYVLGYEL